MNARRLLPLALAASAALALPPAPSVRAADNVPGKFYENRIVGFRFRPLNDWASVPPGTDPRDPKLCGFYSDKAKFDSGLRPECSVYAFPVPKSEPVATGLGTETGGGDGEGGGEGPPKPPSEDEVRELFLSQFRMKSTRQVVEKTMEQYAEISERVVKRLDEKKAKKAREAMKSRDIAEKEIKTDDGVLTILDADVAFPMMSGEILQGKILAGFLRNDEYEVGVVYEIPGSEWKKYANGMLSSLRSLQFMEGTEIAAARKDLEDALTGKSGDERWLEEIKRKVGPGWDHLQTRNYLLVFDRNVKPERVRACAVQIEAIRKDVYEVIFPPDRPVTAVSVVRICKDIDQYHQYGGPGGSAGYWNSGAQELVFYDEGTKDAYRTLYHEAFHQYIFYSVGSVSPHDWFNEGHGDYFAGHNIGSGGKFVPKPFAWRTGIIKTAMGSKSYVPLKTFVHYTHEQYYGPQIGQNYAQGWSMIWFLRRTRNPEWKDILPVYFGTLKGEVTKWVDEQIAGQKASGTYTEGWRPSNTPGEVEESARKKAIDAVFGGWDDRKWARFEKEWLDFKYN